MKNPKQFVFLPQKLNKMITTIDIFKLFLEHPVVTIDSRNCPPGSIFFAIRGDKYDGNAFAADALKAGPSYAIIDREEYKTADKRLILVDNALGFLRSTAIHNRFRFCKPVIAITGTNGKTTTKELVAAVLSKKFNVLRTEGNLNNHIGLPLTMLRLTEEHDVAVVELGASAKGEIEAGASIAMPDYGLITNVGYAHLEGFGSFDEVLDTKCELLNFCTGSDRHLFLNMEFEKLLTEKRPDIVNGFQYVANTNKIRYGMETEETLKQTEPVDFLTPLPLVLGEFVAHSSPFLTFKWRTTKDVSGDVKRNVGRDASRHVSTRGRRRVGLRYYNVETRLVGDYNLENALAAITVGLEFGLTPEQINEALSEYTPSNNRSQLVETGDNNVTADAYNANPSSMRAALLNFAKTEASPKAVILGDMLELGTNSLDFHKEIIDLLVQSKLDAVLLCGQLFKAAAESRYQCFDDVQQLCEYLTDKPLKGYNILLKASHGIHLEKALGLL